MGNGRLVFSFAVSLLLGVSSAEAFAPIRGGVHVKDGDRISSFTVAVRHHPIEGREFCSGSLISPHHVLTAAHCMLGKITVHFGVDAFHPNAVREITPESVAVHPGYDAPSGANDLAILTFSEAAPASASPIALPKTVLGLSDFPNRLEVAGFGLDEPGVLKTTQLRFMSTKGAFFHLKSRSANDGVGHGDSGGPAFTFVNGEAILIGVLSSGGGKNAYYSRVDSHLGWVLGLGSAQNLLPLK